MSTFPDDTDLKSSIWECRAKTPWGYSASMEVDRWDGTYVYGWSLNGGARYRKTRILRDEKTGGPRGYDRKRP